MNNKLLNAILAMDSYNRGYNYGINLGDGEASETAGTHLGSIEISDSAGDAAAQNIGFYAVAYQYQVADPENPNAPPQTKTVISYRGTDNFFDLHDENGNFVAGGDVIDGYASGGGFADDEQSRMAIEFYRQVAGDAYDPANPTAAINVNALYDRADISVIAYRGTLSLQ